ncbi:hypothetical protein OC846_006483 [Tilletia horrida]|uniref:Uncharacterized protein n=1 Tax=Tilletia horrida TaxID=155126 RepID=A0AAN6JPB4_9BASI|nr:hypothetical protein OC846_006483 [Tilletia horrida]
MSQLIATKGSKSNEKSRKAFAILPTPTPSAPAPGALRKAEKYQQQQLVNEFNWEALVAFATRPLSFDPAAYPTAFENNGQGSLYLRKDKEPSYPFLDRYEARYSADRCFTMAIRAQAQFEVGDATQDLRLNYVRITFAEAGTSTRLDQDEVVQQSSRRGHRQTTRDQTESMTICSLRGVKMSASNISELRADETGHKMERVLIALSGHSSLSSAIGVITFPWDTDVYPQTIQAAASTSTSSVFGEAIRNAIVQFLGHMRARYPQQAGQQPEGWRLQHVLAMTSSSLWRVRSVTLMKDIMREDVTSDRPGIHYFGPEAGPGPMLERRLVKAVDSLTTRSQQLPAVLLQPFDYRFYWNLWLFSQHVLLLQVNGGELIGHAFSDPHELREQLLGFRPMADEIERVKMLLRQEQHAIWSLRSQRHLSEEEARTRLIKAREAHAQRMRAPGGPWSEKQMHVWEEYANAGADRSWTIDKKIGRIPCPDALDYRSEQHKVCFLSRKAGTEMVTTSALYDIPRKDPDEHNEAFDEDAYHEQHRATQSARAITNKLVLSPLSTKRAMEQLAHVKQKETFWKANCQRRGLVFLAYSATQHRCAADQDAQYNASDSSVTRQIVLVPSDVVEVLGAPRDDEIGAFPSFPIASNVE